MDLMGLKFTYFKLMVTLNIKSILSSLLKKVELINTKLKTQIHFIVY